LVAEVRDVARVRNDAAPRDAKARRAVAALAGVGSLDRRPVAQSGEWVFPRAGAVVARYDDVLTDEWIILV